MSADLMVALVILGLMSGWALAATAMDAVPGPKEKLVRSLPPPPGPPEYAVEVGKDGGITATIHGRRFLVESTYSYPYGGANVLGAAEDVNAQPEPSWRVESKRIDAANYRVAASGKFYSLDRQVVCHPTHVLIEDTIENIGPDEVGIILSNRIRVERGDGRVEDIPNSTIFVNDGELGLGMVPLDDVYRCQCERVVADGVAELRTDKFGLDKGASYTVEWAVYPTGSADYFDFVNAVRKEEGLTRTRVDGSFSFPSRDTPPSREYVENRGLAYICLPCLSDVLDVPGLDIEGFEFIEMPKERARLRKNFEEIRKRHPRLKTMWHVAHPLYATSRPDERFPDSRIIGQDGRQPAFDDRDNVDYYSRYFTAKQVEEGYRWFCFYPTVTNSFGRAMLKGVDTMLSDEIGCTGMNSDGLIPYPYTWYTYDTWDNHSVEIDPRSKTISRKMAAVNLLAQDALIATIRKINARGGVFLAHNHLGTRTMYREPCITFQETYTDSMVSRIYLGPTVIGLGDPSRCKTEVDLYNDIRSKLQWGALYFYYGEREVTHKTVTSQMFPITVQEIHRGYIKGLERLITLHSGIYGWPGVSDLHFAYLYDREGRPAHCRFLTTCDADQVRTDITLNENQTAVLRRIPVALKTANPVNVILQEYGPRAIQLTLNGQCNAILQIRDGDFAIKPGAAYLVKADTERSVRADEDGELSIVADLSGPLMCRIEPAE